MGLGEARGRKVTPGGYDARTTYTHRVGIGSEIACELARGLYHHPTTLRFKRFLVENGLRARVLSAVGPKIGPALGF